MAASGVKRKSKRNRAVKQASEAKLLDPWRHSRYFDSMDENTPRPRRQPQPEPLPPVDAERLQDAMRRMVSTPKPPGGWGKKKPPRQDGEGQP
jgi:hypothetical protein